MNEFGSQAKHDIEALLLVDAYYASVLDCEVPDLRASGWTRLTSRAEDDPMSLLFGMRQVVYLFAPLREGSPLVGPAGVASLAEELREPVERLLDEVGPEELFHTNRLLRLHRVVRDHATRPLGPGCEPRLCIRYVTRRSFRPYLGRWVEWIERLDESTETEPFALALLARHGGGVFVVRREGAIVAHIGLRAYSPRVWELAEPRLTKHAHASLTACPEELFTALVARATRAALDMDRIPVCMTAPKMAQARHALESAGYLPYARASIYATVAR
ncbi:MAG TPA: hypothetical protein VFQ25_06905 [Ktedonobacterales bacterium]|nr:hypothetical protein [Ktedonobacterales bacterium]